MSGKDYTEQLRAKWAQQRAELAAEAARMIAWGEVIYALPPTERPYGQRGRYPKPPYYPKNADGLTPCRWCRKPQKRGWCSKECLAEYWSRADWKTIKRAIQKRDQVCRICGGQRYERGRQGEIYERDSGEWVVACQLSASWEVDHIVAVSEGGDDRPENLRLLCGRCHREVSAAQAARWAEDRRQARRALAGQGELL